MIEFHRILKITGGTKWFCKLTQLTLEYITQKAHVWRLITVIKETCISVTKLPLMAKKLEISVFLFFNILNVFLPGSLEFLPLTCRYVVQRSFKYLRCLYLQIFGAPLLWFPPYITPHFSISSHPGNLKVFCFLTLQAKKIVLYCLSSSYPTACR